MIRSTIIVFLVLCVFIVVSSVEDARIDDEEYLQVLAAKEAQDLKLEYNKLAFEAERMTGVKGEMK